MAAGKNPKLKTEKNEQRVPTQKACSGLRFDVHFVLDRLLPVELLRLEVS